MKNKHMTDTENTKTLPKFKALDAVIILLVILAVVGVYFRYNLLDKLTTNHDLKEYTVSFSVEDIRFTTQNYISVGDQVYYADDGEKLGILIGESEDMAQMAFSVVPASEAFIMEDGTVKEVFYPNDESRVDASGRMICVGSYTDDGGFMVAGSRYLSAGQKVAVRTELVSLTIVIQEIQLAE